MADISIQELKDKIAKLRGMGENDLAAKYEAELSRMEASAAPRKPIEGDIVLGVSANDFEKSASKFAAPGLHLSVFGMPYWKTQGKSLAFPYTIIEGDDTDKSGEIYCGVSKEASWKIKEILTALGVAYKAVNGGNNVAFNPADAAGKQAKVLYAQVRDSRTPEEGGKGTIYTKAAEGSCVYPATATLESIGMTLQSLLLKNLV